MLNKTSKYMSLPLQLYKMGPSHKKVTWHKKKIKPCRMANDVEVQEKQRDNTIQKANILSFQVSLTKQKLKDLGRRTLSNKKFLLSTKHCYQYSTIVLPELVVFWLASDFVTNTCSYGESWDSSREKSWVPVHNQGVLSWKCLGLCVTRQLLWRQMPKLFITVYWN